MGQITKEFAEAILVQCQHKYHPPLTVWETEQLARAWIKLDSLRRAEIELVAYVQGLDNEWNNRLGKAGELMDVGDDMLEIFRSALNK